MLLLALYFLLILVLSIYSYALVDPNITFFNHPLWTNFRNIMVEFGYNRRQDSWLVYLIIVILLFVFNYILVSKCKKLFINPFRIALIVGILLVFSFPFLSHDFFSYIFYTRIWTLYHHNPYTYLAGDFYLDPWLRFTQWTGNNYPYGPIFLLITAFPSLLGFAKFAPTFFLFKITTIAFYLLAVKLLEKLNKKLAIMFATNPLIIVEGLVNGHNDLISTSLVIVGLYYLLKKKKALSTLFIILSVGIKYLTFPFLLILAKFKNNKSLILSALLGVIIFWTVKSEIQPWYFIILFGLLPFYENLIFRLNIFFFGLLMSYYPYVRFGGWGKVLYWTTLQKVEYKHNVILIFFLINIVYLFYFYLLKKRIKSI
ncbi:MAG: glycosyltransferase 87 family protein [Candidatus Roizmanbacteria bacterium]